MPLNIIAGEEVLAAQLAPALVGAHQRRLIIMMGLPASGKTTLARELEKLGARRVSRDTIRKRLYGDESAFGDWRQVSKQYYRELCQALTTGGAVVSDNVNITFSHRKGTIAAARHFGCADITIVFVDVPLAVCLQRNRARSRHVSEDVIASLHADLKKQGLPRASEGNLLVVQNGKDKAHYRISKVRMLPPTEGKEQA